MNQMDVESPYLSIVAVSRNDDHGAGLLRRMQHFVDCLNEQVNKFQIPTELILVEWNPPADRPLLREALSWPKSTSFFGVRIITVQEEVHNQFRYSDNLPLFQMIGKNIGIRRAQGEFVLATNIDIIFSSELMQEIASKKLRPGFFYRVDRVDVDSHVPSGKTLQEKLEFCRTHVIRINSRYYLTSPSNFKALIADIIHHPALLGYYCVNLFHKLTIPRLHYNACGDFTLMAKKDWISLRGYPELEMYSLHIDSLFLMAAAYAGLREHTFSPPCVAYHIEHSIGSGVTPGEGQRLLLKRLDREGIPCLTWRDCIARAQKMRADAVKENRPLTCNDHSWGLGQISLQETKI